MSESGINAMDAEGYTKLHKEESQWAPCTGHVGQRPSKLPPGEAGLYWARSEAWVDEYDLLVEVTGTAPFLTKWVVWTQAPRDRVCGHAGWEPFDWGPRVAPPAVKEC